MDLLEVLAMNPEAAAKIVCLIIRGWKRCGDWPARFGFITGFIVYSAIMYGVYYLLTN